MPAQPTDDVNAPLTVDFLHRLRCTQHAADPGNPTLADVLTTHDGYQFKALVFVDAGLADANPPWVTALSAYLARVPALRLAADPIEVPGGERSKNRRDVFDAVVQAVHDAHLCRQSYVIVAGGGAVLDVVGFAAAIPTAGFAWCGCRPPLWRRRIPGSGSRTGLTRSARRTIWAPSRRHGR